MDPALLNLQKTNLHDTLEELAAAIQQQRLQLHSLYPRDAALYAPLFLLQPQHVVLDGGKCKMHTLLAKLISITTMATITAKTMGFW
jgi:hypothetical protein